MMHKQLATTLLALGLLSLSVGVMAQDAVARDDLGRAVKLKILVDKVIGAGGEGGLGWGEQAVKETAEAGFNVFSPRIGGEDMEKVSQMTLWCGQHGIYHVPWMRGTLVAPEGPEADGKRVVWSNGAEQAMWSVNSEEFWQWTTNLVLQYAQLSVDMPDLIGVFLDYENYAPGPSGGWMLYGLMYDDVIMAMFAEDKGLELPELALAERAPWLEENGLHDDFRTFQIASWRERCKDLREAVDALNPSFQFFMYPSVGSLFMQEAGYREWGTEAAPVVIATPHTYGRPGAYLPQADALEANRQIVMREMAVPTDLGVDFLYTGGIDPAVRGADPEFSGKNALMMSEVGAGYWVFYEGPIYTETSHAEYMRWFKWANEAMDEGRFEPYQEPRETAESWVAQLLGALGDEQAELVLPEVTGEREEFDRILLRFDNVLIVAAKAGQPVDIVMGHQSLGPQPIALRWEVRDGQLESIGTGEVAPGTQGSIAFTPEADGVFIIPLTAGGSAYWVVSTNAPLGISAASYARFIFSSDADRARRVPLHFYVPDGLAEFNISIAGQGGGEMVRVDVLNPQGETVATGQTTEAARETIVVTAGDDAGDVWSVILREADSGAFEDNSIRLDNRVSPIFSLSKEHVFRVAR